MKSLTFVLALFSVAAGSILFFITPAFAQETTTKSSYSVIDAKKSSKFYDYLTVDSVMDKMDPELKKLLPEPASSKLVLLEIKFKTNGDPAKGNELDPTDLEVQWMIDEVKGKSPVVGIHLSKDFIIMGSGSGFFTTMRPDIYELFCIVPAAAKQISLAQRQPDTTFKVVKSNITLGSETRK